MTSGAAGPPRPDELLPDDRASDDRASDGRASDGRASDDQAPDDVDPDEQVSATSSVRLAGRALRLAWDASPRVTATYVVVALGTPLLPVLVAWATKAVLDGLQAGAPTGDLLLWTLTLAGIGLVAGWAPQVQQYLRAELNRAAGVSTLELLYRAVGRLQGLVRFETPRFLDRLRLAQQSSHGVPTMVVQTVFGLLGGALTIVGFLASLLAINRVMGAAVVLAAVPVLVVEMVLARRRADVMWRTTPAQRREFVYGTYLTDPQAAQEIRLFGFGPFLLGRILADRRAVNAADRLVDRQDLRLQVPLGLCSAVVSGAGLVWAVLAARAGRLTVGDVTLFVAAVAGVQAALSAVIQSLAQAHESLLLFGHLDVVLRAPRDLPVPAAPTPVPPLRDGILVEDVWFRYAPDLPWVLRGVDLWLPAGTSLGLVGVNGAGKSTLVKLLCRFYDPERGRILWDGVDLRDLDPEQLRSRLGAVFQNFVTYDLTAAENIALGRVDAVRDRAQVVEAARLAGIDPAVRDLPRGYDTLLTRQMTGFEPDPEGPEPSDDSGHDATGVPLSGGQSQRLALARAYLGGSDLLVLDEPSSGLDAAAEHEIHRSLQHLRAGTTALLISHRLGALRSADRIVVLDAGEVREEGDHATLVAADGVYARLFALQAQGYGDLTTTSVAVEPAGTAAL